MLKLNKRLFSLIITLLSASFYVNGQQCSFTLSGKVVDESTGTPLSFASVYIEEAKLDASANEQGEFTVKEVCPGEYHIIAGHLGCEMKKIYIEVTSDTSIVIKLHHHGELLDELEVHGHKEHTTTSSNSINEAEINSKANKTLSEVVENVAGVSSLKNGSGISKPVIHGLYGNRLSILNNGIAQSGQQWGNDHAPEIDPFMADHISVIKGASALEYGGSSLGGAVLVEMGSVSNDPHLHGQANYIFQTNGLGHTFNFKTEKKDKWFSWRTTGTVKHIGDRRSPNYYLTNTGNRELNFSFKAEKWLNEDWFTTAYYSFFSTRLGILRGSHIGNLTDLEDAFGRDVPFFTKDEFSYRIEAPKQDVKHHLLKLEAVRFYDEKKKLKLIYGGQFNNRKEFDVRKSGRTNIPALSLQQFNQFLEAKYEVDIDSATTLKSGFQFNMTDNTNNPETEILPLIPDYREYINSVYSIYQKQKDSLLFELGARIDYKNLEALTISSSLPRKIERFRHHFLYYSLSTGVKKIFSDNYESNINIGFVKRAPMVNELYSAGLHQGVSGIEEGDSSLMPENSIKLVWGNDWKIKKKMFVQVLPYAQLINNFIYLSPESEYRLTIRGAFPVYTYNQTDAFIGGVDFLSTYELKKNVKFIAKYSFLRGNNISENIPLVYMPANNAQLAFNYAFKDTKKRSNTFFKLQNRYVFKQNYLLEEQDFLPAPDGYFLLNSYVGTNFKLKKSELKVAISVENILNTTYRDYLNRLRYFSDDIGRNISVNLNYQF